MQQTTPPCGPPWTLGIFDQILVRLQGGSCSTGKSARPSVPRHSPLCPDPSTLPLLRVEGAPFSALLEAEVPYDRLEIRLHVTALHCGAHVRADPAGPPLRELELTLGVGLNTATLLVVRTADNVTLNTYALTIRRHRAAQTGPFQGPHMVCGLVEECDMRFSGRLSCGLHVESSSTWPVFLSVNLPPCTSGDAPGHRKRRQFKQTDAFTRGMVIGLKRAGWSIRQIAADTHLGAFTVHRLWRRWLEQGNVAIYRNVGATRVTSARVDRRILRQAVAAPQATCTAILQHVQDTLDHSISTRTISRRLVANGLHSCRPLRRLPLTPPNRRQRLEWCRARSTWMTEWHRVVFSDESRFCLSSDSRRVRVWRRRGERSNPAAIVTFTSYSGTMTAQRYVDDVLRPVTLPYLQGVPNALYQQDNARPHTARISQQALQDVQMLPWPPYSPDLSPIEHVWDIIGRRLHALPQPRSEDELWQMVEREWRAIPQDAIRTLIDSLPRRVAACIAVRGGRWVVPCRSCERRETCWWDLAQWRPYSCVHPRLTREDLARCLAGRKVIILFLGDSTNRGMMHYVMERMNGSLRAWDKTHGLRVWRDLNAGRTVVAFAYYPRFWLPRRPLLDKTLYQLVRRARPLEDSPATVLVVGGVHWLTTHHLAAVLRALRV
ncbi:CPED1 [Cordylochernes scorpioides]|uniref:CPED1 n=1 Tax=Cordylochernes scorpioides TaxID=51811 RepID=A0ABY6KA31_9ARAC|nr:CPED1 [Cordylochernes scorpioides]